MGIQSIRIQNFKSIKDSGVIELDLVNVLIGANGVGKSNFISFFKFLNQIYNRNLQLYVAQNGRTDNLLFFGRKASSYIKGKITFDNEYQNEYEFTLVPDQAGSLIFSEERSNTSEGSLDINTPGAPESQLKSHSWHRSKYLRGALESLKLFHFHDTGFNSRMKQPSNIRDYAFLQEDGGNIGAFLYRLQESNPDVLQMIVKVIQSVAPFFDDFYLAPDEINPDHIYLRWQEKGFDQLFTAHNLSDGTLRMICLTTLLLQPNPPNIIIIDEPELGLHPFAITKLAGLLQTLPEGIQVIISTQSVNLVNEFSPGDVIVMDRGENQSTRFTRQSTETLGNWLKDYSLGELWEKNILGGRPK